MSKDWMEGRDSILLWFVVTLIGLGSIINSKADVKRNKAYELNILELRTRIERLENLFGNEIIKKERTR